MYGNAVQYTHARDTRALYRSLTMSRAELVLASALRALMDAIADSDFAEDFADDIESACAAMESVGHDADSVSDETRSDGPRR